ncbi:MAG TPA: hypothetical protein VGE39_21790 [Prosthecobacter sp.]
MPRLFKDRFTQWLETQGQKVEVYQPGGIFGCPPMGWQLHLRSSSIAYVVRQEQADTLHIILLEREQEQRRGLGSPFADFVRFVSLVKKSAAGIVRIQGRVLASERGPDDKLEAERIASFYHRHLGGKDVSGGPEVTWLVGELEGLEMPLSGAR